MNIQHRKYEEKKIYKISKIQEKNDNINNNKICFSEMLVKRQELTK